MKYDLISKDFAYYIKYQNRLLKVYSFGRQHFTEYVRISGKKYVVYIDNQTMTAEIDFNLTIWRTILKEVFNYDKHIKMWLNNKELGLLY